MITDSNYVKLMPDAERTLIESAVLGGYGVRVVLGVDVALGNLWVCFPYDMSPESQTAQRINAFVRGWVESGIRPFIM